MSSGLRSWRDLVYTTCDRYRVTFPSKALRDTSFIGMLSIISLILGSWRVGIGLLRLELHNDTERTFLRDGSSEVAKRARSIGYQKCTRLVRIGRSAVYLLRSRSNYA